MSNPYDFENTVAVKILVRKEDKILLVREPETNDWMPGRLGLPGGKPLLNETLSGAIERKIKSDIGMAIEMAGFVQLINILMEHKTVYHLILAANWVSGEIDIDSIEPDDVRWYSREEVSGLDKNDFTEYYNDELITKFLKDRLKVVPLDFLLEQDNRTADITQWMSRG